MERFILPRFVLAAWLMVVLAAGLAVRNSRAAPPASRPASGEATPTPPTDTPTLEGTPPPTETPDGTLTPITTPPPTETPTGTPTPPATLHAPADGAILPQPVAPDRWFFEWEGPRCGHEIHIDGPGGRSYVFDGVMGSGPPPSQFSYAYTQALPLPADALGPWFWHVTYDCGTYQGQSETRAFWIVGADPTPTPTPDGTQTPTETPMPTPPPPIILEAPADGAVLPQPVAPDRWQFEWEGPRCGHKIHIDGPGGRSYVFDGTMGSGPPPVAFVYIYSQAAPFPADALAPWSWYVTYDCGTYQNQSETRAFSIEGGAATATVSPTATTQPQDLPNKAYLPLLAR